MKNWYKIQKQAGLKQIGQAGALALGLLMPSSSQAKNVQQPQKIQQSHIESAPQHILNNLIKQQCVGGKINTRAYKDTKGIPTIGIGYNLIANPKKTKSDLSSFGYNQNQIKQIINGQLSLTQQQAKKLSNHAINQHINRTKKIIKKYDSLPPNVQSALVSAVYRGDLGPKTASLMNQNRWQQAAKQYLNNKQYINDSKNKKYPQQKGAFNRGISGRMQRNFNAFYNYKGK